ncbi:MAG: hypothetical protein Q7U89_08050 [Coriobacteriia bacterium]|nr:hypothetical protein [Coriobacteriia bacterium]
MRYVTRDELRKVTYLDVDALGDRIPNLMPLWDGNSWHLWVPAGDDIFEMRPSNASYVDYVAKAPVDDSDLLVPFVEFMWQRGSWPDVCPWIGAICDDFHDMGTSVAKLRFFFDHSALVPDGLAPRFAETEIEYLLSLTRSCFDLLQEMISRIWAKVALLDEEAEAARKGRQLPKSYADIILYANEPRTPVW